MSPVVTATVTPAVVTAALPVHPRRTGWRAGAAAALVDAAVADLAVGRSPAATVVALADLGGYDLPRGLAGAQELDRRLAEALRGRLVGLAVDAVVGALLDTLPAAALDGLPHPGERVASSVDVVPCAVHAYEAGAADCVRLSVRSYLVDAVRPGGPAVPPGGAGVLATRVASAARGPAVQRSHDEVLATLWLGVMSVAAWRAYAAAR